MATRITNANRERYTEKAIEKAKRRLALYEADVIRLKMLKHTKKGVLYKLDVGFTHRLVTKNREDFELLTHSEYNTLLKPGSSCK